MAMIVDGTEVAIRVMADRYCEGSLSLAQFQWAIDEILAGSLLVPFDLFYAAREARPAKRGELCAPRW